jgi:hypothetical protein
MATGDRNHGGITCDGCGALAPECRCPELAALASARPSRAGHWWVPDPGGLLLACVAALVMWILLFSWIRASAAGHAQGGEVPAVSNRVLQSGEDSGDPLRGVIIDAQAQRITITDRLPVDVEVCILGVCHLAQTWRQYGAGQ